MKTKSAGQVAHFWRAWRLIRLREHIWIVSAFVESDQTSKAICFARCMSCALGSPKLGMVGVKHLRSIDQQINI